MTTAIIEVYEEYGLRTIRIPTSISFEEALYEAEEVWRDREMGVLVRVLRELPGGMLTCVCQFPPKEGEGVILPLGEAA